MAIRTSLIRELLGNEEHEYQLAQPVSIGRERQSKLEAPMESVREPEAVGTHCEQS